MVKKTEEEKQLKSDVSKFYRSHGIVNIPSFEEKTLKLNNLTMTYRESRNTNDGSNDLIIFGGKKVGNRPCFIVILKYGTTSATLQSLERGPGCFVEHDFLKENRVLTNFPIENESDHNANSRNIVQAAGILAKQRGAENLEITDNSYIQCTVDSEITYPPPLGRLSTISESYLSSSLKLVTLAGVPNLRNDGNEYKVGLADLSFTTTGKTWYESIFSQLKPKYLNIRVVESWRNRVLTAKWSDFVSIMKHINSRVTDDIELTGFDISESGSMMTILHTIKMAPHGCEWFVANLQYILSFLRMPTLKESAWITPI